MGMDVRSRAWALSALVAALAACSSAGVPAGQADSGPEGGGNSINPGNQGNGDGPDASAAGSGVLLFVGASSAPTTVGGFTPSSGSSFVVVDFTLKNVGAKEPLPTSTLFFSLATSQALVLSPSLHEPSSPCGASTAVGTGGQLECQVAFEVPAGQTALTLRYDDKAGDATEAPVPSFPPPSAACEAIAGWPSTSACQTCEYDAVSQSCASDANAYSRACQACSSCQTSPDHCSCEAACEDAACRSLFSAYAACMVAACSATCTGPGPVDGGPGPFDAGACGSFTSPNPTCNACLQGPCCAQDAACSANAECTALLACDEACADQPCQQACAAAHPNGVSTLDAFLTCVTSTCSAACTHPG
jgi:hypothetical protein